MRITKLGEDILRQKAQPFAMEEINDELRSFIDEMFDTMIEANGVGLAGPQAGISKRIFVVIADDDGVSMASSEFGNGIFYSFTENCDQCIRCLNFLIMKKAV